MSKSAFKALKATLEGLEDEIEEETGVRVRLPLDEEGADILLEDGAALERRFPWLSAEGIVAGAWGRTGEGYWPKPEIGLRADGALVTKKAVAGTLSRVSPSPLGCTWVATATVHHFAFARTSQPRA